MVGACIGRETSPAADVEGGTPSWHCLSCTITIALNARGSHPQASSGVHASAGEECGSGPQCLPPPFNRTCFPDPRSHAGPAPRHTSFAVHADGCLAGRGKWWQRGLVEVMMIRRPQGTGAGPTLKGLKAGTEEESADGRLLCRSQHGGVRNHIPLAGDQPSPDPTAHARLRRAFPRHAWTRGLALSAARAWPWARLAPRECHVGACGGAPPAGPGLGGGPSRAQNPPHSHAGSPGAVTPF